MSCVRNVGLRFCTKRRVLGFVRYVVCTNCRAPYLRVKTIQMKDCLHHRKFEDYLNQKSSKQDKCFVERDLFSK